MKNRVSSGDITPPPKRPPADSGVLEPIPDPERISSVDTVRAMGSDPQLGDDRNSTTEMVAIDIGVDPPPKAKPKKEQPKKRPRVRERAITNVYESIDLKDRSGDDTSPPIGDRYRIVEKVGAGGMSQIFKVRHINMDKEFALKVIEARPEMVPRVRKLFMREARTASQLDHPNIVQIIDFGVDARIGAYLVMEYLKGETLYERLGHAGRLLVHQALDMALQVAEALHHMHSVGVIHCDVKAENVFLCSAPAEARQTINIKMIDFGLSRPKTTHLKLAEAEVGGTPHYMAPELINGEAPQPSMDIYSLGVLIYEMLTGTVPFAGPLEAVINAQLREHPLPPSTLLDEPLESRVEALIMEMLQKDPAARQRSMGQVIFQLRTVIAMYDFPGARKRGNTTGDRPVISTKKKKPIHEPLVDKSPLPMFLLDAHARLVYANEAFCHFVQSPLEKLRGRTLEDTRLAVVYPSIHTDVLSKVKQGGDIPLQRAFSFVMKDGRASSMLCWLVPEADKRGRIDRVHGYIHLLG